MDYFRYQDPKTGKYGFYGRHGRNVPCVFNETADCWSDGMIFVSRDGWKGFLNEAAHEQIDLSDYVVGNGIYPQFVRGICCLVKNIFGTHKMGCIDKQGKETVPFVYDNCKVLTNDREAVIYVERGGKKEILSLDGKKMFDWPQDGSIIKTVDWLSGMMFKVAKVGEYGLAKYGIINAYGASILPIVYDDIRTYHCGRCAVKKDDKWGFIGEMGIVVVRPNYFEVKDFYDGVAFVNLGSWRMINLSGGLLTGYEFNDVKMFSEGLCPVKKNGAFNDKWGFVDTSGRIVIDCQFAEVGSFSDGICRVKRAGLLKKDWEYIGKDGNLILGGGSGGKVTLDDIALVGNAIRKILGMG